NGAGGESGPLSPMKSVRIRWAGKSFWESDLKACSTVRRPMPSLSAIWFHECPALGARQSVEGPLRHAGGPGLSLLPCPVDAMLYSREIVSLASCPPSMDSLVRESDNSPAEHH